VTIILFRYNFEVVINILDGFTGILYFVSLLITAILQVPGESFQSDDVSAVDGSRKFIHCL